MERYSNIASVERDQPAALGLKRHSANRRVRNLARSFSSEFYMEISKKNYVSYAAISLFILSFLFGFYVIFRSPLQMTSFSEKVLKLNGIPEHLDRIRVLVWADSDGARAYWLVAVSTIHDWQQIENVLGQPFDGVSRELIVDIKNAGSVLVSITPYSDAAAIDFKFDADKNSIAQVSLIYESSDRNDPRSGLESMRGVERSVFLTSSLGVLPYSYSYRVKHIDRVIAMKLVYGVLPTLFGLTGIVVQLIRLRPPKPV